jgi:hypothetical protein
MLSNVEKEKLVIDLYYDQHKNVRQIAQEARISFRDIAAILKKKEAAAVNGDGSGSGNRMGVVDNQQQQLGNGSSQSNQNPLKPVAFCINKPRNNKAFVGIPKILSDYARFNDR